MRWIRQQPRSIGGITGHARLQPVKRPRHLVFRPGARRPLRHSCSAQEPRFLRRRHPHAGPGHRRQHRHLLGRQRHAARSPCHSATQEKSSPSGKPKALPAPFRSTAPTTSTGKPEPHLRRYGAVLLAIQLQRHRRFVSRRRHRGPDRSELLLAARRQSAARPRFRRRGRSKRRKQGRHSQPRFLEIPLRRIQRRSRQNHFAQRRNLHADRRDARLVPHTRRRRSLGPSRYVERKSGRPREPSMESDRPPQAGDRSWSKPGSI